MWKHLRESFAVSKESHNQNQSGMARMGSSASGCEVNLEEVTEIANIGLCLDTTLSMAAAVREIKSKEGRAHAQVSVVSYSLR